VPICEAERTRRNYPFFSVRGTKATVFDLPIGLLIATRRHELGITSADLARRVGYRNIGKGVRRIDELCRSDFRAAQFIVGALPRALELPEDDLRRAIQATGDELDARERGRLEEGEQRYRATFEPHLIWTTEFSRPTSITMAILYGIPTLLRFNLDVDRGEKTFVSQAIAAMPEAIHFFGNATGFTINYSPDRATRYDAQGNTVATFSKAQRLPQGDVTLKDGRSLLPLIQGEFL
jgi:hypothetical protein